jgi:hypothetical protein
VLKPNVSTLAADGDVIAEIQEQAARSGLGIVAWIIGLHTSSQAKKHPGAAQTTVYGDPLGFCLCPSHPDAREYVTQLVVDVAVTYQPVAVELESIEYMPLHHGYHHELGGVRLDPYHDFLLGLDFNPHTKADMERRGVDVDRVSSFVRRELDRFFAGHVQETGVGFDYLPKVLLSNPDLGDFLRARIAIITDLITDITTAVHTQSACKVHVITSLWRPFHLGWIEGYDTARLASVVDRLVLPAYYDLAGIAREVVNLGRELETFDKVTAILDVGTTSIATPADLVAAVDAIRAFGIDHINFYNYSQVRDEALDWIRLATRNADDE